MGSKERDPWERKQAAAKRRRDLKERAVQHLGGKCQICGYDRCLTALEFHHVDALEKDIEVSRLTSWARVVEELRHCALLCCRCHREVHDGWHTGFIQHEDTYRGF